MAALVHRFRTHKFTEDYQQISLLEDDEQNYIKNIITAWQNFVVAQNLHHKNEQHICPADKLYKKYQSALNNYKTYIIKNYHDPEKTEVLTILDQLYYINETTGIYMCLNNLWLYNKKDHKILKQIDLDIAKYFDNVDKFM